MGWRGDTQDGTVCWFTLLTPPALIIVTTVVGFIPMCIVVVLYSIILYHAIRKVIQLKKATQNTSGVQEGRLRMFRGGGSTMVLDQRLSVSQVSMNAINHRNVVRSGGANSELALNQESESGTLSEPEEPMEPKSRFARFFRR